MAVIPSTWGTEEYRAPYGSRAHGVGISDALLTPEVTDKYLNHTVVKTFLSRSLAISSVLAKGRKEGCLSPNPVLH